MKTSNTLGIPEDQVIYVQDKIKYFPDKKTAKVFKLLNKSNLTELSKSVGIHRSYLSKIKHGKIKITERLLRKLEELSET